MKHHPLTLLVAGALALLAVPVHAALLAYEPFTNAPGTAIIGSSGGFGFTNAWQANGSGGVATNTPDGLQYADQSGNVLQTATGAGFFQGLTSANTSMQPNRQFSFSRATNGEAAITWISMLLVRQGPTNGTLNNPFARGVNITFDYPTSSGGANQRVGVGNSSGAATNTVGILNAGGNLRPSANPPYQFGGGYGSVPSITNFVILRIDHIAGTAQQANDNAYLWINPANLAVEPLTNAATTNVLGLYDYSIGLVRVFVGGQNNASQPYGEVIVDELRVGETYADVTPYTPTAIASLVITNTQLAAGNVILSGQGGTAGGAYELLANASVTTASSTWPVVASNTFDLGGTFSVTQAVQPGNQFFRVRTVPPPAPIEPSIVNPPTSLIVTQSQPAAFSVTANGTAPLSYQWYFNTNTLLGGQTSSNLNIGSAQATNAGTYSVRVSNGGGSVTSAPAALTVLLPPGITTQPQSQSIQESNSVNFSVVATGTAPLTYQWYFDTSTLLSGATNAAYGISSVTSNNAGAYSVIVANNYGAITSAVATLTVTVPSTNGNFYVAPTGNDANPGTFEAPFATLGKAQSVAQPGNIIYMRGGTYYPSATINITNSGTAANRIQLLAYPGETPYLNFTNQPYGDANRGILFRTNAAYWNIKGIEIGYAGDNGVKVEGHHLRFEQCVFHHNGDTGLQIGFGHTDDNPDGQLAAHIEVINCDSYENFDDGPTNGGNADGFAAKMHCGRNIIFTGCRAWGNSDDGWDLFETDYSIIISNCWTWKSGFLGQGNGNGFKLGGNGTGGDSLGTHYAYNCVSFGNKVNGFTQNSHKDGVVVLSCLSFTNGSSGYNYFMEGSLNSGKQNIFKNNVGIRRNPASSSNNFIEDNGPIEQNNSWNLSVTPNYADYGSVLEAAALAPRQPDGSLPTGFVRLVSGSDLIDQGVDIGSPFNGAAPDLGPYEYAP
jgi:hypothetical protein